MGVEDEAEQLYALKPTARRAPAPLVLGVANLRLSHWDKRTRNCNWRSRENRFT